MSKDYASKNKFSNRRKSHKKKWVGIAIVVIGLFAMLCLAVIKTQSSFLSNKHFTFSSLTVSRVKNNKNIKNEMVKKETGSGESIQFDFYTELPGMQVNKPASAKADLKPENNLIPDLKRTRNQVDESIKSALNQHTLNKVIKDYPQYILQFGEFKNQITASQLRLSLLLAGIDTNIVVTKENFYRVQQGPFLNQHQAKVNQRKVNKKGFESAIKSI